MTIYALSSPPGRSGVAVIRISGTGAGAAFTALCGKPLPAPRYASLRKLRDPRGGLLDKALVLWFPAPASFTGEDMAELHLHGGRAVIAGVLDALLHLGLRLAEPGEFTRRAFENGKLDLTEAEGLADLINADTPAQRSQALSQAAGRLRERFELWRAALLRAMAYVEASLDFADEGDIAEDAFNAALPVVRGLVSELERALADARRGEVLREGVQVAILGAPNVGKSSLLNALAGREAAIVFDEPGTTRDIIEVTLDIEGFPFVLRDTAGLRETASAVEQEGIRRALSAAREADLVLYIIDASTPHPPFEPGAGSVHLPIGEGTPEWSAEPATAFPLLLGEGQGEGCETATRAVITIANKTDLSPLKSKAAQPGTVSISVKTGEGIDALKDALASFARDNYGVSEMPLITRARHRQEIGRAKNALEAFLCCAESGDQGELSAEHLREAADALGRLTGRVDAEDILGQIFSEFCIGK